MEQEIKQIQREVKPQTEINIQKIMPSKKERTEIVYKKERDILRCPECKGEIKEQIVYNGFWKRKKTIIYYCPLCDFENIKTFRLNEKQYKKEVNY